MNLVSLIMQFLGPALVGKLASSLGLNQTLAQKVIAAAVPAILAGLAGKAAQPGGAGALFDILAKQDSGLLGKLASVIGTPQQKQVADQGSSVLGSVLGNSALGQLAGALTKYSGAGEAPAKGLLGILAPIVLGTLSQQQKNSGLDAGGLAKMLSGQKDNISAALPSDFAKLLGPSGLLDSINYPAKPVETVKPSASPSHPAPPRPAPSVAVAPVRVERASTFSWWPWLIAIALACVAWWYMFANPRPQMTTAPATPRIMAGANDIGGELETSLKGLQGLLGSIKDQQSAQAALPRLRETQATLDRIGGLPDLSADSRRQLAAYVASWLPTLTPLINNLLANTAVAPFVKPVLDGLAKRLETMAKG